MRYEHLPKAVKTLASKDAEAIITAAHAIYKEHIYPISDYYAVRHWLNNKALRLTRELRAEEAVKTALRLNEQIEAGQVKTPVKLKPIHVMEILARKFIEDSDFRTTINVLKLSEKESYAATNTENQEKNILINNEDKG